MRNTVLMGPTALVLCLSLATTVCDQKVQTTRTALHVARSLNPDSMESMSVKTKAGDLTTIIVKKRNGKSSNITENTTATNDTDNNTSTSYVLLSTSDDRDDINGSSAQFKEIKKSNGIPVIEWTNSTTRNDSLSQNRTDRSDSRIRVPDPVYVSSSMMYVKNELNANNKKSRSLVKLDVDGIPVVTGVRVPDDDTDKQVWRNARVINGILVPYDKADKEIVTKTKPSRKPSTMRPTSQDDTWTKIGTVTKKPTKLSPAPQVVHQSSWNDPKWDLYKKPVTLKPLSTNEPPQVLQTIETIEEYDRLRPASSEYKQHPLGLWIPPETEENPEHKYVTDRILEYIRNINKEEMKRLSMQKFTVRDARMLPTSQEQPQIQSRILHVPGASVFPNSAMYSPSTQSPSRVSFEEGVRTPVLQYAHPEFGVQSAKVELTSELADKKESYYGGDIHADRGPFVFEPATPAEQGVEADRVNNQRSHTAMPYYQRPKKTLAYFYPEKQTHSINNKYYGKYPPFRDDDQFSDAPTLYYEDLDGRPFWIRFGDSLKEQVQSGIERVTDLTRPVVEPLMEATHKISQNLGLSSGNRDLSTIREKLGSVSTSSLILPAIGIVAGGAALGLGAVAVGRYLNYDVVKMRKAKAMGMDDLAIVDPADATHLEGLWAEDNSRSPGIQSSTTTSTPKTRRRRSVQQLQPIDRYFENMLQTLESNDEQQISTESYPSGIWSNTPCSKRIFCEAMLRQSEDSVALMDKKIYTFLSVIHPDVARNVSPHLEEVMKSVKTKNCSIYLCPSRKSSFKQSEFADNKYKNWYP